MQELEIQSVSLLFFKKNSRNRNFFRKALIPGNINCQNLKRNTGG